METSDFELPTAPMAPVALAACSGKGPLLGWQIVPFAGSVPFAKKARVFCAIHVDAAAKEVCCVAASQTSEFSATSEGYSPRVHSVPGRRRSYRVPCGQFRRSR